MCEACGPDKPYRIDPATLNAFRKRSRARRPDLTNDEYYGTAKMVRPPKRFRLVSWL